MYSHNVSHKRSATKVGVVALAAALAIMAGLSSCAEQRKKSEIVIGYQADLSGGISSWGYWLDKSIRAAVEKVNKEGGIAGKPVRLVVEDTETNPPTGVRKLRKLILDDRADFVIGSVHSGVMMASVPVAKELKTIYIPIAMASEATAEQGNRYVFRMNSHVHEQVNASAEWVVKDPNGPDAKKWTICVTDYEWGWSHQDWFTRKVKEAGGEILTSIRIPQGTKDFMPYISNIPKDTEAIYFIFFGADSLGFIQQLYESGYRGKKFTAVCTLEAIDIAKLGEAAEGTWVLEYLPREMDQEGLDPALLSTFKHPYYDALRQLVGIDAQGHEISNPDRAAACSHLWATYESVFMLKKAIEQSGWQSRADDDKLIQTLEGIQLQQSYEYPQGDNTIRPEDHQGFHQHWMSHVEKGKLVVKFHIPAEKVVYPPPVDFRKQG
jgi:branched-chain amino acid transport system substrate-binding protein